MHMDMIAWVLVEVCRGPDCTTPRLVSNLSELKELGAVPTAKRGNPKQRRKGKQRMQQEKMQQLHQPIHSKRRKALEQLKNKAIQLRNFRVSKKRKSIYRDNFGERKRRRF